MRRIDAAIDDIANAAAKDHYSPAAVAQALSTALRTVVSSIVEEVDELKSKVEQLERKLDDLQRK